MLEKYQPEQFENKWIEQWEKDKVYRTPVMVKKDKKAYVLVMFPYPSGAGLHAGHVRVYTGTDVVARFLRMRGYSVLNPMGWDAFGLPAENGAIKEKKNPKEIVARNVATFKNQMKMMGFSFDWDREINTTDPTYYKWTQFLFIQLFKLGLLYKTNTTVYYCESCKTGLAEEEVLPNGTHERCGKPITRKILPQWVFRITTYADRLLSDLKDLQWPKGILEMQKNWIGKQTGLAIDFITEEKEKITVWTKYWETIFGVTFLVVAPEYSWVTDHLKKGDFSEEVRDYVKHALAKTDEQRLKEEKQKTGVFTGKYTTNPVNGKNVPIWIADYVLSGVGTGAVMGVPAHDERDFAFAKKYELPITQVVSYEDTTINEKVANGEKSAEGEGRLINSAQFDGQDAWGVGKQAMATWMIEKKYADWKTQYHLRDWIFSRQRYWGEPIPMIYCESCAKENHHWWETADGKTFQNDYQNVSKVNKEVQKADAGWFPIDQKSLPLELPYLEQYEPGTGGESPLAIAKDWKHTQCPSCGGKATYETDTMPNWAGSCWYFLRFADHDNSEKAWDEKKLKEWLPVDWYIGGAEHAVLHLLYSRFWVKAMQDLKLLDFSEPFMRLDNVGMVIASDHRKMSKSFGNVVNPNDVVAEYGADALRVYEMFMAPFDQEIAWSTTALQGSYRFIKRTWDLFHSEKHITKEKSKDKQLVSTLQKTIEKVTIDLPQMKFNTAIAMMMECINAWEGSSMSHSDAKKFLQLLAPIAPFMTDEIWHTIFGEKNSIHNSLWPDVDKEAIIAAVIIIPVQIDGKVRGKINAETINFSNDTIEQLIKNDERMNSYIQGKQFEIRYIPGKIISVTTS